MNAGGAAELVRLGFEDHLGPAQVEALSDDAPDVVKLFCRVLRMGGKPTLSSLVRQQNYNVIRDLLSKCPESPADRYDSPPGPVFTKIVDAASWLGYPEILELCREQQPELYAADTARSCVCRAIGSHNRDGCHAEYFRLIENQLRFLQERGELDHALMSPFHWLADGFLQSRTYGFKCQQLPTVSDLLDFAELFLTYGFDVNFRCVASNRTALAVAAGNGPVEYVEFLIQNDASLCADDPEETNPLSIASRKEREEVVAALKKRR
jgi:hypothetical protein